MQQGDYSTSYHQYYQSQFENPNPSFNPTDLYTDSLPPAMNASAPPISPRYSSPFPQNPDHLPSTASTYPPNLNSVSLDSAYQLSTFPHIQTPPQQTPYYPYDKNQAVLNHDNSNPNHSSDINSSFSSTSYSPAYNHPGALAMPDYESSAKFGSGGGYFDEKLASNGLQYDHGGFRDDVAAAAGVYAYKGTGIDPYGARGTGSESSTPLAFDDYGRPIRVLNRKDQVRTSGPSNDIVRAIPKTETQQDVKSWVQKFRVKLLAESGGQSNMDVLCQIGLDGIRMLDPSTSRTLKIYPLETVTKCEVLDSSIFAFWSKSSIDFEPRRIRLKSNNYTTNTILDTVTAASVQLKEMGEINKSSDSIKASDQLAEKKKGLVDWVNLVKPRNEEKDHWVPDEAVTKCNACGTDFGAFLRKHHCRNCGDIFCDKCTQGRTVLNADESGQPVRVCDQCMAEVTQRLSNARETTGQVSGLQSHEDLAKKLQEEMNRKRQTLSGIKSDDGFQMHKREVACPTCTVHLEVEVPTSGSKTIECSVCQHPFLVNSQ